MVNEWSVLSLDKALDINPRVQLEKDKVYPFVDMKSINPSVKDVHSSEYRVFRGQGSRFRDGDTLLARITPCLENGKIARYVSNKDVKVAHGSTEFIVIRGREGVTDNLFAYYLARSEIVCRYLISQMSGSSGRQRVPVRAFAELTIELPPLIEQRAIAGILGALDDKIELNRQMCKTLEDTAQAIFKSWFIDFDPVHAKAAGKQPKGMNPAIAALFPDSFIYTDHGSIPKGWSIRSIGEMVKVYGGGTPSTRELNYWIDGIHPFCTPKDMAALSEPILLSTERKISDYGLAKISSGQLPIGTVLLSSRAPIGYLAISRIPVSINQGIIAMVCDFRFPNIYALHWTKTNLGLIVSQANGSTFLEISKSNFRLIKAIVPTVEVLNSYMSLVEPLYFGIESLLLENELLNAMRDELLPKLISGNLRIRDAENIVGRSI
jgi:type I restriction enzyme S subunit